MREHDIGAIPIGENDRLVGMVTDRDIVCRCIAAGLDPKTATARDVMTEGIIFCLDKQEVTMRPASWEQEGSPSSSHQRQEAHGGMLSLGDVYAAGPRRIGREVMHEVSAHHE